MSYFLKMSKSSNWSTLRHKISEPGTNTNGSLSKSTLSNSVGQNASNKRKRTDINEAVLGPEREKEAKMKVKEDERLRDRYLGLDCEMVGIGPEGRQSALARCSIVDYYGKTLFDHFVRPPAMVTDFRTKYSGVRKADLRLGHAISLTEVSSLMIS